MFYSEAILSRRGPLAKVWLAAHMERKLSKNQTLQTDIEQSVDAIMGQEVEVMALRLSGQLLLGVVRIYSRKAKYLLDDCNEALLKIKMAFRPGIVDMTEDQLAVNRNAITLQSGGLDLDLLLPDINWGDVDFEDRPAQPHSHHVARAADITLATADDLQFGLDDPGYGLDLGPSDGIGSQDFEFDLGLDFGDSLSAVEVGRDAAADQRLSDAIGGQFDGVNGDLDVLSNRSRDLSEHPFADIDMEFGDFGGGAELNLGLDFGDREKTPGQTRSPSRASSPLTEGPVTPPPDANITPRKSPTKPRQPKPQKQIIDNVTELADGPGARLGRGRNAGLGAPTTKDVSEILTSQHFLPRSSIVMRLLEIRDDPLAHFLPTITKDGNAYFCAAPPGLAPELAELFMRPLKGGLTGANKRKGGEMDKGGNKKMRMFGEDLDDVEQGMRAGSMPPSVGLGSDILGRGSVGPGLDFGDMAGMDDFQMDIGGDFDMGGERGKSVAHTDRSRMSTPGPGLFDDGEETYADLTCPIAMFDVRPNTQSQNQTQETETEATGEGKGYSKNTVKALGVIRKELMPRNDREVGDEEVDKMLSFKKMSEKSSRRAAASFFFELLVLGTRDCVQITQSAPFENIEVRAKDKLWERQRHASVARSIVS